MPGCGLRQNRPLHGRRRYADRQNDPFKNRYERLQGNGNPAELALVAVMRPMLCTLTAMPRTKST